MNYTEARWLSPKLIPESILYPMCRILALHGINSIETDLGGLKHIRFSQERSRRLKL